MSCRRAFTLIELLIVMFIIATLAGLSLAALRTLRISQARASTLVLMKNVAAAMDSYRLDYPVFGDAAWDDFAKAPLNYLYKRPVLAGKIPYIEVQSRNWGIHTGAAATAVVIDPVNTDMSRNSVLLDAFGNEIAFTCVSGTAGDVLPVGKVPELSVMIGSTMRRTLQYIRMRSNGGTMFSANAGYLPASMNVGAEQPTARKDVVMVYDANQGDSWAEVGIP